MRKIILVSKLRKLPRHLSRTFDHISEAVDLDLDIDALVELLDKDDHETIEFDEFTALFANRFEKANGFRPKTPRL